MIYEEGCQERYQEGNCSGTVLFHDRSFCSMNTAGSLILIKLVSFIWSLFIHIHLYMYIGMKLSGRTFANAGVV